MKTYIKFLSKIFLRSFIFVSLIVLSLVIIVNFLGELEFFKKIETTTFFTLYLSIINSPLSCLNYFHLFF